MRPIRILGYRLIRESRLEKLLSELVRLRMEARDRDIKEIRRNHFS